MHVKTVISESYPQIQLFFAKFLSEKQPLLIFSNIVYIPLLTDWGLFLP